MDKNFKKIVIVTGIYPPEIGGPAEYAKNLGEIWRNQGYKVNIKVFSKFNFLPSGLRHLIYFFYCIPSFVFADYIFIIDTFSAAMPAATLAKILGKKTVLRTGGDFLWESYVERTGEKILLKDFYNTQMKKLSLKEKTIFQLIKWTLRNSDTILWSTEWQKNIFMGVYGLKDKKHRIVENYYGPRYEPIDFQEKVFIASSRESKWKNIDMLEKIFEREDIVQTGIILDLERVPHGHFIEKVKRSYAVIIVSLGDISPNVILDAIMCQKPFILTKENGLYDRIKDIGIFVDPLDENDIVEKIKWLSVNENYQEQKKKIEKFDFVHSWEDIAYEYMSAYSDLN